MLFVVTWREKKTPPLLPSDPKQQALVDQWMTFSTAHVSSAMGRLTFNRVVAPMINETPSEESIKDGENFLARFLPIVDKQIRQEGNLAGKDLTLADIALLSVLDPAEVSKVSLADYPALTSWRTNLKKEKFYQDCFADYSDCFKQ